MIKSYLSNEEFLQRVWLSDKMQDPVVARLVSMAQDLVVWEDEFGEDVYEAINEKVGMASDVESAASDLEELRREVDRLRSRSLIDMLSELHSTIEEQEKKLRQAAREAQLLRDEAARAVNDRVVISEKMDMWTTMNKSFV